MGSPAPHVCVRAFTVPFSELFLDMKRRASAQDTKRACTRCAYMRARRTRTPARVHGFVPVRWVCALGVLAAATLRTAPGCQRRPWRTVPQRPGAGSNPFTHAIIYILDIINAGACNIISLQVLQHVHVKGFDPDFPSRPGHAQVFSTYPAPPAESGFSVFVNHRPGNPCHHAHIYHIAAGNGYFRRFCLFCIKHVDVFCVKSRFAR